jgi:hypothetical protein
MAKNQLWNDDYWLLLMQLYLSKPVGAKPMYSRGMVALSMELHIPPQQLYQRQSDIANLETPRIERIWKEYSQNPQRLSRAVRLLREMKGFNSGGDFFEGVAIEETFERDFRPLEEDSRLMPFMLVIMLDLYFCLTPATMVKETPEVRDLASLMKIPTTLIVEVLHIYQYLDPYLRRKETPDSVLLQPCRQIWERYANMETTQLAEYAEQLRQYFK